LNILVFGINLDSTLNDVGVLLACGVIKKITCETVIARFSTATPHKVGPAALPVFNSKAHDEDSKDDSDSDKCGRVSCQRPQPSHILLVGECGALSFSRC
jgi:hypothetical protein